MIAQILNISRRHIINQEYESLKLNELFGPGGHARSLFGSQEKDIVREELALAQPFNRRPAREPQDYGFEVIGLYDNVNLTTFKDLVSHKKLLYRKYRTP